MGGNGTVADGTVGRPVRTLDAALRSAPMPVDAAIRVASSVADEVAALHAAGLAQGDIDPSTVAIDEHGEAALVGPPAPRSGPAAPPALRSDDLQGVGRVLAAALGWPRSDRLPTPVADLVARAGASAAPAGSLATALRRLEREPLAVAALLPPAAPAAPGRARRPDGALLRLIPRADRRTTGTAAAVVAGAAAVGAVLLLIGSPAGTGRGPAAAAEAQGARTAAAPAAPPATEAADAAPQSVQAILRASRPKAGPAPARTAVPVQRVAVPAVEVAAPVPTPTPTAEPTSPPAPGATPSAVPAVEPRATAAPPTVVPTAPPSSPPSSSAPSAPAPTTPVPASGASSAAPDPRGSEPAQPAG